MKMCGCPENITKCKILHAELQITGHIVWSFATHLVNTLLHVDCFYVKESGIFFWGKSKGCDVYALCQHCATPA